MVETREDKSAIVFVNVSSDMDCSRAESLIHEVRNLRYLSYKPVLTLTKDDFEHLATFWPGFYLTTKVEVMLDGKLVAWLKKLFRMKARTRTITFHANDSDAERVKAQILERKAIIIDGRWVDIVIAGGTEESTA